MQSVRGAFDCDLRHPARADSSLRLRQGEVLYLPAEFTLRLSGARTSSTALLLTLDAPAGRGRALGRVVEGG
ncbi:hypothetical protein AB0K43_13455 [Kitasatospora sp. NPDC049258]|uniref:hypothetical protein n=1 Tax=Kitasatospora sp. NPDC049258 TaxID=3155394 RepID=UPI00342B2C95